MPTTTTRLKLPRPLGTDNFNLANQQALIDAIESNAAQRDDYTTIAPYAIVTGTTNAYTATVTPAPTTYTDGMAIAIKINTTNTTASTLNINGLGAKSIRKPDGSDVSAGELVAGSVYTLRYNGTNFIMQGAGSSTVVASNTSITDSGDYYVATNVEGALQEIGQTLNGARTLLVDSARRLGVV